MRVLLKVSQEYRGVIRSIRRKAKRNGVKVRFDLNDIVYVDKHDKTGSAGFFYEGTPLQLAVGIGKPFDKWISVLLHESSHMDQFFDRKLTVEKRKLWEDGCIGFFEWLAGNRQCNQKQLDAVTKAIVDCERDCEIRTVEKIKHWGLPINLEEYIKKANTYLFGYELVKQTRTWHNELYNYEDVWKEAPTDFYNDYSIIPANLRKALEKRRKVLEENIRKQLPISK